MIEIVEASIAYTQSQGILLVRGPSFDITQGTIQACGWDGAVLLCHRLDDGHHRPGWLKKLCAVLGKDSYWFWRFNYGFNQGRALSFYKEVEGKQVWYTDKVSEAAMHLSRGKYHLFR